MSTQPTIRQRLAWPFDLPTLRRIKRLWVRHSIAEDARDIDGLIATLAPDCVYEIVPTGQRWEGHAGARAFYSELFGAFPDNAFALTDIVVGPQGVFEVATLTGTNLGPWAGAPPSGLPVSSGSSSTSRGIPVAESSPGSGSTSTGASWAERSRAIPRLSLPHRARNASRTGPRHHRAMTNSVRACARPSSGRAPRPHRTGAWAIDQ